MNPPPLLRPYQEQTVRAIMANIENRPLMVLPTGGGKTVVLSEAARRLGLSLLWVSHRKELNDQAQRHLDAVGVEADVLAVQKRSHPERQLVIVDECQHAAARSYAKFADYPYILGATATPFRRDGRGLGNMFGCIIVGATPRQLVDQGYLFAPKIYTHGNPDMRGVSKRGGDFNPQEAHVRMLKADIINTYRHHSVTGPALGYATTIEHSKQLTEDFNRAGITAEHVDGNTPRLERERIFADLRSGAVRIVWNVNIATEGFDIPHLDCAILARPTDSLGMYLQMVGRVMRPQGGSLILDHAGNALRHGSPLQDINYTLSDKVKRHGMPLGLKQCGNCFFMTAELVCPECGEDLSPSAIAKIRMRQGELIEFQDREEIYYTDVTKYRELFGEPLVINGKLALPTDENKDMIYDYFKGLYGIERGAVEYRKIYKKWPRKYCSWHKITRGVYPC